ncbi:hypothetical protein DSO57_1035657 [Entomophthora muscae]|uniref:Uncharacterized protein n=1 Tax=Entomophthora muscae TaxID=34485 RepID=A0ACC2TAG0_9FUNG|nr:hypothetical protein DSO57_1035657 [Entomophthora muscae]
MKLLLFDCFFAHVYSKFLRKYQLPVSNLEGGYVGNCTINAISIWPLNSDMCKDLVSFTFDFGYSLPFLNELTSMSTHSGLPYHLLTDPGIPHLVFQEIKIHALNFALKTNPRLASNLKSFVIKISCCVLLDVIPRSQTQHLAQINASSQSYKFILVSVNFKGTLQRLKAFIDTGADKSFIDADLAQELSLSASENCLQIIMGNITKDKGYKCKQYLPLVIGSNTYPLSLILLKGLSHPLILGDSWSNKHDLILNY